MTALDQFLVLISPLAVATSLLSGAAFGLTIRHLRPDVDARFVAFLAILLGVLVYLPQAAQLGFTWILTGDGIQPWATLGRWSLFTFAFVPAMWLALRWRVRA